MRDMKSRLFSTVVAALMALAFVGCATDPFTTYAQVNRARLNDLSIGMSKSEVIQTMGSEVFNLGRRSIPSTISNPFKTEAFLGNSGESFEVIFYYSGTKSRDSVITDDELVPIVLKNGKVVGWGNQFFSDVKRVEIRVR